MLSPECSKVSNRRSLPLSTADGGSDRITAVPSKTRLSVVEVSNRMLTSSPSRTIWSPIATPFSTSMESYILLPPRVSNTPSLTPCLTPSSSVNIVVKREASSGENVSVSAVKSATPAAVVAIAADTSVARETLPNGLNPAG